MALTYVGALSLEVLCPDLFSAFASVSAVFALKFELLTQLELSIGLTFVIPDIAGQIALCVELIAGFTVGVEIGLPSFNVELSIAIGAQLAIVVGILALLEPLAALAEAGLEVFSYGGTGASFGNSVSAVLANGWPDGTPPADTVLALVFAATDSGTLPVTQVRSVALLPAPPAPPAPPPPPTLPTPSYEVGLTSLVLTPPPAGGTQATGTVTIVSGAVTAVTLTDGGSGYASPPTVTISNKVSILGMTGNAVPVVITIANASSDITSVTVAGAEGNTAANGQWPAKVLTPTTIGLYQPPVIGPPPTYTPGPSFVTPVVGNGTWVAGTGTVQGQGTGAVASATMGGGATAALSGFFAGVDWPASGLDFVGSIELQAVCGGTFDLLLNLVADLELLKGQLSLQVEAALNLPTIAGSLELLVQIKANLTAALSAIPPMPSISFAFAASIAAQLEIVAALAAQIAFQLGLLGAGVTLEVYSYSGPGSGLGPALTTTLAAGWGNGTPAGTDVQALVLGATSAVSIDALGIFFAGA